MKNIYYFIPLMNFFIASLFGVLLRAFFVFPVEQVNYLYLLHTHSHIALLGWMYLVTYVGLVNVFGEKKDYLFYSLLFWVTQLSVFGMLFSFPFQGYGMVSIFFSTLHIICSYLFVYRLWKNTVVLDSRVKLLLRTALFMLLFSTLGVWFLGPAVGMLGKASKFYQVCIQFFLHFQFEGWFLTSCLTVLLAKIPSPMNFRYFNVFYLTWVSGVVLTFALPLVWYYPSNIGEVLNMFGIVLQTVALLYLVKPLRRFFSIYWSTNFTRIAKLLIALFLTCFFLHILVQLLVLFSPAFFSTMIMRSWIVGFIHLTMLGVLSGFWLWYMEVKGVFNYSRRYVIGVVALISAFVCTEVFLLIQGSQSFSGSYVMKHFSVNMFWISALFPISILLLISTLKLKK